MSGESGRGDRNLRDDFDKDWDEFMDGEDFGEDDPRPLRRSSKQGRMERLEIERKDARKKKRRRERREKHVKEWDD